MQYIIMILFSDCVHLLLDLRGWSTSSTMISPDELGILLTAMQAIKHSEYWSGMVVACYQVWAVHSYTEGREQLPSAYKFEISNDEHDEHDWWMDLLRSLTKCRKFVVNTGAGKITGLGENRKKNQSLWKRLIL